MDWRGWQKKGKEILSNTKKSQLLLILLAGLLMIVISFPTEERDAKENEAEEKMIFSNSDKVNEYSEYLEERIAEALEHVEGVGKTEVVITLESNGQKVVEKDEQASSQVTNEEDSNGGTRSIEDSSSDRTSVYTQQSDGAQEPYVSEEILPQIKGVLVIAEGGADAVIVQDIIEAIQALFGIEAHKIKIMKRTDT